MNVENMIVEEISREVHQAEALSQQTVELPNLISFLHHYFEGTRWASFLHEWESVIFSLLLATLISFVFYLGTRKLTLIPKGLQNVLEFAIENLKELILGVLGRQGEQYVPFLGTLFLYIFCMNVFGLVPLMKSPTSNLNITIALAICVFGLVQYLNIKNMGFFGFLYHLAGSPKTAIEWAIAPLMFPLELLIQLSRPLTLALRLFGNILGEDILIGVFSLIGVLALANIQSPVGLPLQLPFLFLGILSSLMQALVFTLLSTVYILLSIPHLEENHLSKSH
jgi:F-type H+-transporting ATPase subunit a